MNMVLFVCMSVCVCVCVCVCVWGGGVLLLVGVLYVCGVYEWTLTLSLQLLLR
jgi:hypothetical protein